MAQARSSRKQMRSIGTARRPKESQSASGAGSPRSGIPVSVPLEFQMDLGKLAFKADAGLSKQVATRLFQRLTPGSSLPIGKLRAELIPDSSWKRARKTLGPQASQTTARLGHVFSMAVRVWGNESDATEWLNSPHPELRGATPFSLLKTEAGGRAVEALLGALDFGFPV
jgi:putative toxin-antitoxin system antitoxin component (TIGR02293 family)